MSTNVTAPILVPAWLQAPTGTTTSGSASATYASDLSAAGSLGGSADDAYAASPPGVLSGAKLKDTRGAAGEENWGMAGAERLQQVRSVAASAPCRSGVGSGGDGHWAGQGRQWVIMACPYSCWC